MLLKRGVLTVDKEGEARAGAASKLGVRAHHIRVGAVINRPGDVLALTNKPRLRPIPGARRRHRVTGSLRATRTRRGGRSSARGTTRRNRNRSIGATGSGRAIRRACVDAGRRRAGGESKTQRAQAQSAQAEEYAAAGGHGMINHGVSMIPMRLERHQVLSGVHTLSVK